MRDVASSSGAPSSSLLTTQSLSTRVSAQLNALEGLSTRLADIADYLVAVQQGKLNVNHQIIYHIQEIMGLLPQLGGDLDAGKAFRMENNDSGLVVYISHLIRTILALHDLSESFPFGAFSTSSWVVENRIANAQQEIEDAKTPEERKAEEEKLNGKKEADKEKSDKDTEKDKVKK